MILKKIHIGGWFQRTTLHLSEVWDFLKYASSELDLPKDKLKSAKAKLNLASVRRESGFLEYLECRTRTGISFRIYEDGLIVLEKKCGDLSADSVALKDYYDSRLSPAISLIFSKGAPVPKELANIRTILPYIMTIEDGDKESVEGIFRIFKEKSHAVVCSAAVEVYRSGGVICINNLKDEDLAREVIDSQIFFREFKTQLHRYLMIHRILWEKIAAIKEMGKIRGTEIDALRNELVDYEKTITLIGARINQMSAYVRTREKIIGLRNLDAETRQIFELKYETLINTHEYIRHLWDMTHNYQKSAIDVFTDLQGKSTKNSISSLQLVTTIGVVAGIIGYLGKDSLPTLTTTGLVYFGILMILTYVINTLISRLYKRKQYPIRVSNDVREIK